MYEKYGKDSELTSSPIDLNLCGLLAKTGCKRVDCISRLFLEALKSAEELRRIHEVYRSVGPFTLEDRGLFGPDLLEKHEHCHRKSSSAALKEYNNKE